MKWMLVAILAAVLVALFEVPPMVRGCQWRELIIFFLLLFFGLGLSIAQSMRLPIPNPLDWIIAVYKPVSAVLNYWLG